VRNQASAWNRLKPSHKAGIIVGGILTALVLPCVGGLAVIGAVSGDPDPVRTTAVQQLADAATPATEPTPITEPTPTTEPSASPAVVKRTVTETEKIRFKSRRVQDDDLPKGEKEKRTAGADGVRTRTYEVTVVDGRETARKLLTSEVTRKPVTEVIAIGTYVEPAEDDGDCAPGYDPCVPVASDVDCAGGSGNGPAYVDGPIRVTGSDPYDLDRDGDGIACDS
jgi:hypothetical protein